MVRPRITTVPLAELVEDMDVYPRHAVDNSNVQSLALALEAGAELPPVVACSRTKVIVDGWHRCRAYRRVHGPAAVVPVEFRDYPDRRAMVEDAVALNCAHGRRLDVMDQTRAMLMLEKAGVPTERVAVIMHVPEERVRKLIVRVARANVATDATVPGTRKIALKRPIRHLQGTTLTEEQARAHDMMPGTSFLLIAKQLRVALATELLDTTDERLMQELGELRDALNAALGG